MKIDGKVTLTILQEKVEDVILGNQEVVVLPIANGHEHHVIWKYCNHVMNQ